MVFGTLSIDKVGLYAMIASSGGIPSATSGSFGITAASVSKLSFITQPSNTVAGNVMSPVSVKAVDLTATSSAAWPSPCTSAPAR